MIDLHPLRLELVERIDWLIRLRWIAVIGTLVGILVARLVEPALAIVSLIAVTAAIAGYNTLFLYYAHSLYLRRGTGLRRKRSPVFAAVQIALDLIGLTALLHFGGGIENPFAIFLIFHIIIASILLSRRASLLAALWASILYAALVLAEYAGWLPHYHLSQVTDPRRYTNLVQVAAQAAAMTVTLLLAAVMASSVSERLRTRTQELLQTGQVCEISRSELATANQKLHEVDAARTQFIVMVTHQLRAPVGTIASALDLVLGDYGTLEIQHEVLRRAQVRANELLDLIRDLLELSRARRTEPVRGVPVRADKVLEDVLSLLKGQAESKRLSLIVSVAPDAPPVIATADLVRSIWVGLIDNAIKYTNHGGRVVVSLVCDGDQVVGSVQDTGMGVAPEEIPRLFAESPPLRTSVRLDAVSVSPLRGGRPRKQGATVRTGQAKAGTQPSCENMGPPPPCDNRGLPPPCDNRGLPQGDEVGLAVLKRTVESYGGHLWVESKLGKGSRFNFSFPKGLM